MTPQCFANEWTAINRTVSHIRIIYRFFYCSPAIFVGNINIRLHLFLLLFSIPFLQRLTLWHDDCLTVWSGPTNQRTRGHYCELIIKYVMLSQRAAHQTGDRFGDLSYINFGEHNRVAHSCECHVIICIDRRRFLVGPMIQRPRIEFVWTEFLYYTIILFGCCENVYHDAMVDFAWNGRWSACDAGCPWIHWFIDLSTVRKLR